MEASKESEMSSEQAPESLPTEIKEEKPKSKMIWAVIIAVIIVVAAIGAAFGLGLLGGKKEPTNKAPSGGARALTDVNIDIGGSVTFESMATDSDGTIAKYMWWFGDGTNASGATLNKTTHTYQYGGFYWVYQKVEDDKGANATNEAAMIRVYVRLYELPSASAFSNTTAPMALLGSDKDVVPRGTIVTFNMSGTIGVGNWHWLNETNHSEGMAWDRGAAYVASASLDFGDGSAPVSVTPATIMTATHNYTASGHYAAKLTVTGTNTVQTIVIRTIHVLNPLGTVGTVKNPDSFTLATIGEPDYLDPALDYETAGGEVLQSVYENLVWYDGSTTNLIPWLAKEVPTVANGLLTSDGLNYTFNLKTGVKFHDGTAMTADDVVYSIRRVLQMHDPSSPSWAIDQIMTDYLGYTIGDELQNWSTTAPWLLSAIGGTAPTYVLTELDMKNCSEAAILKLNETAVKFRLTHPYPGFLKICAFNVMNIVSKDFVELHGGVVGGEQNLYMNQHTCGTGPYELVVWEVGAKVHMTRFDGYWGAKPDIKDIYIVKANDVNTRILMLQAGDADCIYLPIKYEGTFAGKSDYRIVKGLPTYNLEFAAFNLNLDAATANSQYGGDIPTDFFADKHMRKAFTHLINYTQLINNVYMGNAFQPNGVIPKGMFGYDPDIPLYTYDLAAAEAEFKLAINPGTGNSYWDDGFTIPLFFNAGAVNRQTVCEMIKLGLEAMASPGGMTATLNTLDWPTFLDQVYSTNGFMPLYVIGWLPDYADPDDYANPMVYSYGTYPYFTGYKNATIDGLVEQAAAEIDDTTRADLYSQMSWLVYDDAPYIWLDQANNFHIERAWVQGYYFNPMFSGLWYPSFSK